MLETATISLIVVRNILYFITGGWLFVIAATSLPKSQNAMDSDTKTIVYIFCCFVVWCWIFSKVI